SGRIDLYVEYTGTAYTAVLKHAPVVDRDSVYRTVARDYLQRFDLVWGKPFGFNNTFAITVRRRDATRHGLTRISDLARLAPRLKAGFGYEFLERADGFRGLASVYGLRFASPPMAMDLGLTYRALADGKVDVIAGNSTDGQIEALDLAVLEDDRHYFPPYEAAPVMRASVAMLASVALIPEARGRWSWRVGLVGLAYAAAGLLFVFANKLTTAANTVFLQATNPLFVVALAPWLLRERVRAADLAFMGVLAAGLALLFVGGQRHFATAPDPVLGNVLAAGSAVAWAFTVTGYRWLAR